MTNPCSLIGQGPFDLLLVLMPKLMFAVDEQALKPSGITYVFTLGSNHKEEGAPPQLSSFLAR